MRRTMLGLVAAGLGAAACAPESVQVARQAERDYATYCAGCHGADAQGGSAAMPTAPDLTLLAARNGGTFPRQQVMAQIDGYTRDTGRMPGFGEVMLESELVPVDLGDGVLTPTPLRLLALADYLETLQRPAP